MARKTKQTTRGATSKSPPSASPCNRGKEVFNTELPVRSGDVVDLFFQVCRGVGMISAHLTNNATSDQRPIADNAGIGSEGIAIRVPTTALQPGRYTLTWTFAVEGEDDWTTTSELWLNSAVVFRLHKGNESTRKTNTLFLILEVLP